MHLLSHHVSARLSTRYCVGVVPLQALDALTSVLLPVLLTCCQHSSVLRPVPTHMLSRPSSSSFVSSICHPTWLRLIINASSLLAKQVGCSPGGRPVWEIVSERVVGGEGKRRRGERADSGRAQRAVEGEGGKVYGGGSLINLAPSCERALPSQEMRGLHRATLCRA